MGFQKFWGEKARKMYKKISKMKKVKAGKNYIHGNFVNCGEMKKFRKLMEICVVYTNSTQFSWRVN